jgi:3',5'-cyclic AMP phosphodiesterase CpdA
VPTLLAQLTDPHIRTDDAAGVAALRRAVRAVLDLPVAPDAVVVTGDLADTADPREYRAVRAELAAFGELPVHVLPGNHDAPEAFAAAFGAPDWDVRAGGLRLVGCDSTLPGRMDGDLDVGRLAATLAAGGDGPTIVAMHHPPFEIGIPALDAIGLPASARAGLADLLAGVRAVRRVVCGHVHRTAVDTLGGCGVVACASAYQQARLEIGGTELVLVPDEPASFALHVLLDSGEVVSHVQPIPEG